MPRVPTSASDPQQRLEAILGLSREQARRAVEEIFDALRVGVDEYIALRHAELQRQGESNERIFERIAVEVRSLRFKAPELTSRQIRRRIYG
ncbi:MAG TPA: hypothetical protein VK745_24020 [Polyangiaceae bacterium]|nr:hypothetical protein [Polyangiaceae bacterium]